MKIKTNQIGQEQRYREQRNHRNRLGRKKKNRGPNRAGRRRTEDQIGQEEEDSYLKGRLRLDGKRKELRKKRTDEEEEEILKENGGTRFSKTQVPSGISSKHYHLHLEF